MSTHETVLGPENVSTYEAVLDGEESSGGARVGTGTGTLYER